MKHIFTTFPPQTTRSTHCIHQSIPTTHPPNSNPLPTIDHRIFQMRITPLDSPFPLAQIISRAPPSPDPKRDSKHGARHHLRIKHGARTFRWMSSSDRLDRSSLDEHDKLGYSAVFRGHRYCFEFRGWVLRCLSVGLPHSISFFFYSTLPFRQLLRCGINLLFTSLHFTSVGWFRYL
jgi:hypothetical protein